MRKHRPRTPKRIRQEREAEMGKLSGRQWTRYRKARQRAIAKALRDKAESAFVTAWTNLWNIRIVDEPGSAEYHRVKMIWEDQKRPQHIPLVMRLIEENIFRISITAIKAVKQARKRRAAATPKEG